MFGKFKTRVIQTCVAIEDQGMLSLAVSATWHKEADGRSNKLLTEIQFTCLRQVFLYVNVFNVIMYLFCEITHVLSC